MFEKFSEELLEAFKHPLPGKSAHKQLMPYLKINKHIQPPQLLSTRKGAVMALIYPIENIPHLLLIERPVYEGVHSGQLAFPGGKIDATDANSLSAALRETKEEVGIGHEVIKVAGSLTEVFVFASNFLVFPYVGIINEAPKIIREEKEVAGILEIPVHTFFDPYILKEKPIQSALGLTLNAPYYDLNGKVLWGATAMMVSELCTIITQHKIEI